MLWNILEDYNIEPNLINAVKSLYDNTSIVFNQENRQVLGTPLKVNTGLRQGCGLSPLLFDLYINRILEEWKSINPKYIRLGKNKYMNTILFADDQVLLADSEERLQENITKLNTVLKKYNMNISKNKTKAMAMQGKAIKRVKVVIDGNIIEQVNSFKYLGCVISIYQMNKDLEENVQKYNKLNGCIRRYLGKNMRTEVKLRMYNVISKPALQYGSETWVMREEDKRRIETSEMRFLRSMLGVTRRDKLKSEDIRKQLKCERMVEEIQKYQNTWYNHIKRMSPGRLPRQAYFYKPTGRRDVGRPRKRWTEQIFL